MCFGRLPPEINSGRLFYGCGSATMLQAAASWDELAAALRQTAAGFHAVAASLAEGRLGATAIAIGRALTPCIAWLDAAATQAAHTATQAAAAVNAHEVALAAIVHPDVIHANRARLLTLSTTNCLAQASPTIARIEAEYEQIWVEDAAVMYAYARSSAKAAALTPFGSSSLAVQPSASSNPDAGSRRPSRTLASAPDVIVAGNQVITTIPAALQELSSSPQTTLDVHLLPVTAALSKLSLFSSSSEVAIKNLHAINRGMMLLHAAAISAPKQRRFAPGFGRAGAIGALSVPGRWLTETVNDSAADDRRLPEPIRLVGSTRAQGRRRMQRTQISGNRSGD